MTEQTKREPTPFAMIACPGCKGRGNVPAFVDGERDGVEYGYFDHRSRCFQCNGRGEVTVQAAEWRQRGRAVMDRRRAKGESLMALAGRLGITPAEASAMEHGKADPAPLERAWA